MLILWWVTLHALVVASLFASGLPTAVEGVAAVAALVHAVLRRPLPATPVQRYPDGLWALPARGLPRLTLVRATVGPFSILLQFATSAAGSARGRSISVLLLRDQLDDAAWRALQSELRRTRPRAEI